MIDFKFEIYDANILFNFIFIDIFLFKNFSLKTIHIEIENFIFDLIDNRHFSLKILTEITLNRYLNFPVKRVPNDWDGCIF